MRVVASGGEAVDRRPGRQRLLHVAGPTVVRRHGRVPAVEDPEVRGEQLGGVHRLAADVLQVGRPDAEGAGVALPDAEPVMPRRRLAGSLREVAHDVLEVGLAPPHGVQQPGGQLVTLLDRVDEGPGVVGAAHLGGQARPVHDASLIACQASRGAPRKRVFSNAEGRTWVPDTRQTGASRDCHPGWDFRRDVLPGRLKPPTTTEGDFDSPVKSARIRGGRDEATRGLLRRHVERARQRQRDEHREDRPHGLDRPGPVRAGPAARAVRRGRRHRLQAGPASRWGVRVRAVQQRQDGVPLPRPQLRGRRRDLRLRLLTRRVHRTQPGRDDRVHRPADP